MCTPVTNGVWRVAVKAGACQPPCRADAYDDPAGAQHPVVHITREQARRYAAWIDGHGRAAAPFGPGARATGRRRTSPRHRALTDRLHDITRLCGSCRR
jgi:hypothetical protein